MNYLSHRETLSTPPHCFFNSQTGNSTFNFSAAFISGPLEDEAQMRSNNPAGVQVALKGGTPASPSLPRYDISALNRVNYSPAAISRQNRPSGRFLLSDSMTFIHCVIENIDKCRSKTSRIPRESSDGLRGSLEFTLLDRFEPKIHIFPNLRKGAAR
jgi:hypothetical protein